MANRNNLEAQRRADMLEAFRAELSEKGEYLTAYEAQHEHVLLEQFLDREQYAELDAVWLV